MQPTNSDIEKTEEGVLGKSIKGGKWLSLGYFAQKSIGLISFIILARFLDPADFGIMATVLILPKFIETATNTGFNAAIIQKEGKIDKYLNPIWTIGVLKSILIAIAIFIAGPYIAKFLQAESATLAIQLGGIFMVILNLSNIGETFLFKELDFKKIVIRNVLKDTMYTIVGVSLVLFYKSYWVLFAANIAAYSTQAISTYFLQSYRPWFSFKFKELKSLFRYSKWVIGQSWIGQIYGLLETGTIARLTNMGSLGLYNKAKNMASVIPGFVGPTLRMISFPAYSKLQKNIEKINEGVIKSLHVSFFLLIPITTLIIFAGGKIVLLLLGPNWLQMTNVLRIFLVFFSLNLFNEITYSVFNAIGYPDKQAKFETLKLLITIPLIFYLTLKFSIIGTALALLIGIMPIILLNLVKLTQLTKIKLAAILSTLIAPSISSLIIFIPVFIYRETLMKFSDVALLALSFLAGLLYILLIYFFKKIWNRGPYDTVRLIVRHTLKI